MEVKVRTENPDGSVAFEGTLKPVEIDFVLNIGLNYLMSIGATPFLKDEESSSDANEVAGPDTVQ